MHLWVYFRERFHIHWVSFFSYINKPELLAADNSVSYSDGAFVYIFNNWLQTKCLSQYSEWRLQLKASFCVLEGSAEWFVNIIILLIISTNWSVTVCIHQMVIWLLILSPGGDFSGDSERRWCSVETYHCWYTRVWRSSWQQQLVSECGCFIFSVLTKAVAVKCVLV